MMIQTMNLHILHLIVQRIYTTCDISTSAQLSLPYAAGVVHISCALVEMSQVV